MHPVTGMPMFLADDPPALPDDHEFKTRAEGLAFLTREGNLSVPCSRYGRNSEECALVAWRLAYLMSRETGEVITVRSLDHAMGLVVNDHDDVAYIVRAYGHGQYGRAIT